MKGKRMKRENKEKAKRYTSPNETWVGVRPVIFKDGKYDKKRERRNAKRLIASEENE